MSHVKDTIAATAAAAAEMAETAAEPEPPEIQHDVRNAVEPGIRISNAPTVTELESILRMK